jgi:NADH dehydrogenase
MPRFGSLNPGWHDSLRRTDSSPGTGTDGAWHCLFRTFRQSPVYFYTSLLIPAELVVWAAGVKAPDFLKDLAGLETNRINQLVVTPTLQTTRDESIFALGDCVACAWPENNSVVPPRAQAAHQQASHMAHQIYRQLSQRPLTPYRYRDFGSLDSLGKYTALGNMLGGGMVGGSLMIEGIFARVMYASLYKMHELALHGFSTVALDTLARLITRRTESHVKLH